MQWKSRYHHGFGCESEIPVYGFGCVLQFIKCNSSEVFFCCRPKPCLDLKSLQIVPFIPPPHHHNEWLYLSSKRWHRITYRAYWKLTTHPRGDLSLFLITHQKVDDFSSNWEHTNVIWYNPPQYPHKHPLKSPGTTNLQDGMYFGITWPLILQL